MSSSTSSSMGSTNLEEDDLFPLWKHVTLTLKKGGREGNAKWKCNYCNMDFQGSYVRVKAHLLLIKNEGIRVCSVVSSKVDVLSELRKAHEQAENRKKLSKTKMVPLPPSPFNTSTRSVIESTGDFRLQKAMNIGARETLNSMIARMFYSAGLPFHLARNPYFVDAFRYAAESNIAGYVPPGYNLLRTTLLQKEKANIERLLDPIKKSWNEKGVSICADGWSDAQRRPLINMMGASDGGALFIRAVNCEGEYKDKTFIAKLLGEVIHEVGHEKVVQVITDNAATCAAAGSIIEGIFPKIFWTPCVVHTLNLALKNPPHMDEEISAMRIKCFKKYFPNQDERRLVNTEYAKFSGCLEHFGDADSLIDRGAMEPIVWWLAHGASTPMLQSLALKLLSQPCSSSCCERNWSTYSFIHSMRRNKMTPQRCEDLVFVHSNIRLLSRRTPLYTKGDTKLWDISGDAFDSMEGAGILEVANLSLDEPEMEAILFNDEENDDLENQEL
ncbi:hypothetical protein KSP39_PZI024294 [Platanthera zijinensis]|uniref:BED-type domain-containing protein n=2 Tax=Platanthera zijinensis TaxID=2320716 RepID=A0AAP0ASZ5_9ASPA